MEAYYPWESLKKLTKIGQPYNCHRTKESFDPEIKANLRVIRAAAASPFFVIFTLKWKNVDFLEVFKD